MATLDDAHEMALAFEGLVSDSLGVKTYNPKKLESQMRALLIAASDKGLITNPVHEIIRFVNSDKSERKSNNTVAVMCGVSMDKGQAEGRFIFRDDGARLSFTVVLKPDKHGDYRLESYRFHVRFSAGKSPEYMRFDLNIEQHADPLNEPRCHFHPGAEDLRVPSPVLEPLALLYRILFDLHL